jgi:formiminoglutamase
MSPGDPPWLDCHRGTSPLLLSIPHTGVEIPGEIADGLASPWLARMDTDWHVEQLYKIATSLGATVLRTRMSRTVIDVNRDPTGASLYPGLATTELCPTTTFDGRPLYLAGREPTRAEIERRRRAWFDPYHASLAAEIRRLRELHSRVVVYDCHAIRSVIPRLFEGELPHFNIGTNGGRSCDFQLSSDLEFIIVWSRFSQVTDGRFRGGFITRHYGRPNKGIHAIQMELAMRGYLEEPMFRPTEANWPPAYDSEFAKPLLRVLAIVLLACLAFAEDHPTITQLERPPS